VATPPTKESACQAPWAVRPVGERWVFFRLSSWELVLILLAVIFGVTLLGLAAGRYLRGRSEMLCERVGVRRGDQALHLAVDQRAGL
jgi:hypothetical protein